MADKLRGKHKRRDWNGVRRRRLSTAVYIGLFSAERLVVKQRLHSRNLRSRSNRTPITFPTATASWGTVDRVALLDSKDAAVKTGGFA